MDVEPVNYYFLLRKPTELCRSRNKDGAARVLRRFLGIPDSHVSEIDINEYDKEYHYLNSNEGDSSIGVMDSHVYLEYTNMKTSSASQMSMYLYANTTSIDKINDDILSGKIMFKDGKRAKKFQRNEHITYTSDMSFWFDIEDDELVLWATFETDHDAVMWMLQK